jgi:hypothetical protein
MRMTRGEILMTRNHQNAQAIVTIAITRDVLRSTRPRREITRSTSSSEDVLHGTCGVRACLTFPRASPQVSARQTQSRP